MDVNRATKAELTSLKGLGEELASALIAARPFTSMEHVSRVAGIGPRLLERLVAQGLELSEPEPMTGAEGVGGVFPVLDDDVSGSMLEPPGETEPEIDVPGEWAATTAVPAELTAEPWLDSAAVALLLEDLLAGGMPAQAPEQDFDVPQLPRNFIPEPAHGTVPPENPYDWSRPPDAPPLYGEVIEGHASAVLFVSDFHLSDGSIGDDYLVDHLRRFAVRPRGAPGLRRITIGNPRSGPTRAFWFARIVNFVLARLATKGIRQIDIVLNGDTVDLLELLARGSALSAKHRPLFALCQGLKAKGHNVYYLRGNHDFIAPPGPWTAVSDRYENGGLLTVAQHGDQYDPQNWPRGLRNFGSQVVTWVAPMENWFTATAPGGGRYFYASVDNLRPLTIRTLQPYLQRRVAYPGLVGYAVMAARLRKLFGGAAAPTSDSSIYHGATRKLATGRYKGWLTVQGHTHVPIWWPGVHANTATWISHVPFINDNEFIMDLWPFFVVYRDPNTNKRVDEYFTLNPLSGKATHRNMGGVNIIRNLLGYPMMPKP